MNNGFQLESKMQGLAITPNFQSNVIGNVKLSQSKYFLMQQLIAHPEKLEFDNPQIYGQLNIADLMVLMYEYRNGSFFSWLFNNKEVCDWLGSNTPYLKLPIGPVRLDKGPQMRSAETKLTVQRYVLHFDQPLADIENVSHIMIRDDHDFAIESEYVSSAQSQYEVESKVTVDSLGQIRGGREQNQYLDFGRKSEKNAQLLLNNAGTRTALTEYIEIEGQLMKPGGYVIETLARQYMSFAEVVIRNRDLYSTIEPGQIARILVSHPSSFKDAYLNHAIDELDGGDLYMITKNSEGAAKFIFTTEEMRNKLDGDKLFKLARRHFAFAKAYYDDTSNLQAKADIAQYFPTLASALIKVHGELLTQSQLNQIATDQPAIGSLMLEHPVLKTTLGENWVKEFQQMLTMKQLLVNQIRISVCPELTMNFLGQDPGYARLRLTKP